MLNFKIIPEQLHIQNYLSSRWSSSIKNKEKQFRFIPNWELIPSNRFFLAILGIIAATVTLFVAYRWKSIQTFLFKTNGTLEGS